MMASEHHKKGKISEQAHGINCGYLWSEIAVLKLKASEGLGDLFFLWSWENHIVMKTIGIVKSLFDFETKEQ